jgi:hypothetical protein
MSTSTAARVLGALVAAAAVAAPGASPADEPPSVGQSCIHHPSIKRTKVLNDRNILFVMDNKELYNNVLPRRCPGMRPNVTLSYSYSNNSALCEGSTVTVLERVGIGSNTTPITIPGTNEHIAFPAPAYVATFVCPIGFFVPVTEDEVDLIVASSERERRGRRRGGRDLVTTEQVELPPAAEQTEPAQTSE